MPVYNAAPYLDAAIDSILGQTFTDLELVCLDDGSSDDSATILAQAATRDPRVRILPAYGGNRGVIAARNALLAATRGTYTGWMDADDISAPTRFATQIAFLEANEGFVAVGSAITLTDERLHPQKVQTFDPSPERQARDPEICCATVVARTDAVRAAGPMRDIFRPGGEDGDWILKLAESGAVTNIAEPLYLYRQHGSSTSRYFAPIRRLGVLSRMSARVRRRTGRDPLDGLVFDPDHRYLEDGVLLGDADLTAAEKTLGISLPLRGRAPFASILVHFRDDHEALHECLRSIRRQDFKNHEVVILDDASAVPLDADGLHLSSVGIASRVVRVEAELGFDAGMAHLAHEARGRLLIGQRAADFMREDRLVQQVGFMLSHPELAASGTCANRVDQRSQVTHRDFFPIEAVSAADFAGDPATVAAWAPRAAGTSRPDGAGLLALVPADGRVANMPDILYFRRVLPGAPDPVADAAIPGHPPIPYHDLYYQMRATFGRLGLSVSGDHSPDDVAGLRRTVRQFEPLLRPYADDGELGEALGLTAYMEWRQGERSFASFVRAWTRVPRSAARLVRRRLRRRAGQGYESAREALAPVLPRGAILGRGSPIGRLLRGGGAPDEPVRLRVAVYDAWGDLPDALDLLLPNGRR